MDDAHYKELLQNLECPVCTNYMKAPIFECSKGHSICNACYPAVQECPTCRAPKNNSRNYTLEKVVEDLNIFCKYTQRGCRFNDNGSDINNHVDYCDFGDFNCFYPSCKWIGQRQHLLDHYRENHAKHVNNINSSSVTTKITKFATPNFNNNHVYHYMENAYDKPFMVYWKLAKLSGYIPWCVYYLGDPEEACEYSYQLLIKHPTLNKDVIKIEAECQPIKNKHYLDELSKNPKSMILQYELLALYCNAQGILRYEVNIIKFDK